ncbi:MAG: hypothetical protein LBM28_03805 [Oscillospiraceae bacterium]|jgi:protein-tyrosine phosphatase|nr:hypothetical protein [Oscillospiraceae bacterium]
MRIDFHAHILPGADHGSRGLEITLQQIAQAGAAGVELLAATPHFYPYRQSFSSFLERREITAALLLENLPADAPTIVLGAEVQLCNGLDHIEGLRSLCFAGTSTLLMELPPDFTVKKYIHTLDALLYAHKLQIVLAHVERYSSDAINELFDLGFWGQLNAEAFCRFKTRGRATRWVNGDRIVALGSDLHGKNMGYGYYQRARKYLGQRADVLDARAMEMLAGFVPLR